MHPNSGRQEIFKEIFFSKNKLNKQIKTKIGGSNQKVSSCDCQSKNTNCFKQTWLDLLKYFNYLNPI